jgi:hypothetical protein
MPTGILTGNTVLLVNTPLRSATPLAKMEFFYLPLLTFKEQVHEERGFGIADLC